MNNRNYEETAPEQQRPTGSLWVPGAVLAGMFTLGLIVWLMS